jgi:ATP-dependent RNA helicase DDX1
MVEHAYSCASLHSGRSMRERSAALSAFKSGEIRFLICTDVAARGIDIRELPYVISTPDLSH